MFAYIQERAAHKRQMGKISSSDVYLARRSTSVASWLVAVAACLT